MLRRHLFFSAIAVAACTAAGSGAFAAAPQNLQPQRPGPNAPAPDTRADFRDLQVEGRLAYLKSELRITAAQDQAWDAYANAVRDEARDRVQRRENPPPAPRGRPSVVDELSDRQQRLAAESARLDRMVSALRPLYASLSDDQRRMADRLLTRDDGPPDGARTRFAPPYAWDPRFGRRFYR